jgi:uncharacterized RDD family membrane protein YckC
MRKDATTADASEQAHAAASARVLAYLIDSVVLFCFSMIFAVAAGLVLFLDSDQGRDQITDAEAWAFTAISAATILAWLVAGVVMHLKLGQTVGQYVIGLRVQNEDGTAPQARRLLVYWLALHPLLYHPLFCGIWFLVAYVGISLAESDVLFVLGTAMGLLSLVAPLAGLVYMLSDPQRRTIHDRLAGVRVQRLQ